MSARKIAYNTVAQVSGKFLGFFISSFFLIILAGVLGTTGMGYYTTITAFVGFFVNLADLGINIVMMREIAQNPEKREEITGQFLGFRLVYGLLILALAPVIAYFIPQYSHLIALGIAIAAVAQLILLINQTFVSVLQVSLQLDRAVLAEILNRLVTLGLVIYGAQRYHTMEGFLFYVLWVTVLAAGVNAAVSYWFARKQWVIRPRFSVAYWKVIFILVIPMGITSFLGMAHFKSDTIILSLLKPAYDVGIYGYAYKIAEIMFSIPMMFIGIVFPRMSALIKEDKSGFLHFNQRVFNVLFLGSLPFIIGVFVLSPYLTLLLSQSSVQDGLIAGSVLRILCLAMIAWFFGSQFQHILLAGKSYKGLMRNLSIAVVLNIVLNLIFIPIWSYYAAAWITVITEAIMAVLTIMYVHSHVGFLPKIEGAWPVLSATVVMAVVVSWVIQFATHGPVAFAAESRIYQMMFLGLAAVVGSIVYGLAIFLWGKSSPAWEYIQRLKVRYN